MQLSKDAKEWIVDILVAILIAVVVLQFIMPTIVREHSMENTLEEHDYLFVSKKAYTWFGTAKRGDIIVFQSDLLNEQTGKDKLLIKRIIALPGDTVKIHDGITYVNGVEIIDTFTKDGYTLTEMAEMTVPENSLFCMGDNRQNSADSRDSRIGCVDMSLVKGKAIVRLWPLSKFGSVYENIKESNIRDLQ